MKRTLDQCAPETLLATVKARNHTRGKPSSFCFHKPQVALIP
jgi:hypothetical protein